jgi:hypothetical protein
MSQPKISPVETAPCVNRLRRVLDDTKLLHSTIDLTKLTELILAIVRDEIGIDRATVFLVDWDRREVKFLVAQDVHSTEIRLLFGNGIAGAVAATGETLDIQDAYADSRFNPRIDAVLGYETKDVFCMPVVNREGRTVESAKDGLFKSEDVMQQRSQTRAWFHNVKDLHEWRAKTVEPSAAIAAPIAINAK